MKSLIARLKSLRGKKNLLAFSYGLDSTTLYHLLKEAKVDFDIAFVNYRLREEAEREESEAKELVKRDKKKIYIAYAPEYKSNFEARAREFRYKFFESLIDKYGYDNLLTAHQLNDRLEWMMMRLIRGAGVVELIGTTEITQRQTEDNKTYNLIRPLINTPRFKLQGYLESKNIRYFIDKSNNDPKYERNRIRVFVEPLIKEYSSGIARSFQYLEKESAILLNSSSLEYSNKNLHIYNIKNLQNISTIASKVLKELGYLLSRAEREILDNKRAIVAGRKWVVEVKNNRLFITPYIQNTQTMPKEFKEQCRIYKIPPKIRPWLYKNSINPKSLKI